MSLLLLLSGDGVATMPLAPSSASVTGSLALTSAGTVLSIAKPAGLANGDVVYGFLANGNGNTDPTTVPTGFVNLGNAPAIGGAPVKRLTVYRKVITDAAGEPANYSWAWAESGKHTGIMGAYSNVSNTTPEDATTAFQVNSAASGLHVCPSITTVTANAWMLCCYFSDDGTTVTWPGGMTERADIQSGATTTDRTISDADEPRPTAGATGTRTVVPGTSDGNGTVTIAMRPATVGPVTLSLQASSATASGTLTVTASGPVTMPLAVSSASATGSLGLRAATTVVLTPTSATASGSLAITASGPVTMPLAPATASATGSLGLRAATTIVLTPASATASGSLVVTTPLPTGLRRFRHKTGDNLVFPSESRSPAEAQVPSDGVGAVDVSGSFRWGVLGATYSYPVGSDVYTNDVELILGLLGTGVFEEVA